MSVFLAALSAIACSAHADPTPAGPTDAETIVLGDLPRRAWLGVGLDRTGAGRLRVQAVLPGGSAEGQLEAGDVLLAVDGADITSMQALGAALKARGEGERMAVTVLRGDDERTLKLRAKGRALEQADDLDIVYDVVVSGDARLRSITTRPAGARGPLPAVLFIQGLSCASIENMTGPSQPVEDLLYGLSREGFAVMRVEKQGMGDSQGGAGCAEVGFDQEVQGFRDALAHLKAQPDVDADAVFLFGHSMGGLQGPVIAADEDVAGVAVYGTGALGWPEYLVDNARRQARLSGADPAETERYAGHLARFVHEVMIEGRDVAAVLRDHPDLSDVAAEYFPDGQHGFSRHVGFFQELSAHTPASIWARVDAPVLAMVGEYDFATSAFDHQYIAEIVNYHHPDSARWLELPGLFHAFNTRASQEEALADPWGGEFGRQALTETASWMRSVLES